MLYEVITRSETENPATLYDFGDAVDGNHFLAKSIIRLVCLLSLLAFVITSDSLHYTKLYDFLPIVAPG